MSQAKWRSSSRCGLHWSGRVEMGGQQDMTLATVLPVWLLPCCLTCLPGTLRLRHVCRCFTAH